MTLVIREADEADIPHLLALYAEPEFDGDQVISESDARRRLREIHANLDHRIYLAWRGDRCIGTFALLIMRKLTKKGRSVAIVDDVVVATGERGGGVGKEMMQEAMNIARKRGCYKLMLSSNLRREQAHRFYESLGFEQHGWSYSIDLDAPR